MFLLGTVAAIRIPDYWNDQRYLGNYTWHMADQPRYGNETAWMESAPNGYKEADIMDDAVIAAQEANYGLERVVQPYLLQLDSQIPDYWNDDRYLGNRSWAMANQPRYGNETAWVESSPVGYREANIFDDSVIAAQEANYGLERVVEPYLLQTEESANIPDYWNDARYGPNWGWAKANEPRYGNESAWLESRPVGYREANIFDDSVIASQEAQWNTQNIVQPYLVQGEADIRMPMRLAQEESDSESYSSYSSDSEEPIMNAAQVRRGNSPGPYSTDPKGTYQQADSASYISPYTQRDHAWYGGQYDVSNETHWVDTSAVDGYKIPITADDADQFFAQKASSNSPGPYSTEPKGTYQEPDSASYISPYTQRDHAWYGDQYDVSNETHWVDTSAVDGYKIPITADDADQFAQVSAPTHAQLTNNEKVEILAKVAHIEVTNNDYNWLCDVRDEDGRPFYISNYAEYYHCAVLGRVTPFDILDPQPVAQESFAQTRVPRNALAQVATQTKDYDWLCDVRGEDGKPFYIESYGEYAHCATLARANTDDVLE